MTSRRWLLEVRFLAVLTGTVLLLSSLCTTNVNAVNNVPGKDQLADIRSYMDRPTLDGVDDPTELLPEWYIAWRILLQNQIDQLFVAIEKRPSAQARGPGDGGVTLQIGEADGLGFKILVVGDSTMRMQANVLSWLLSQRTTSDGRKQCSNASEHNNSNRVDILCYGADQGFDENGNPVEGQAFVLRLLLFKTFTACVSPTVDADFVYFGCGLHFLQLVPDREMTKVLLDTWVHYRRLLEEAVAFYRSGDGNDGKRVPIGEAFMTTHSFAVERLVDEYAVGVREYQAGNETLLKTCRAAANGLDLVHKDWPNEYEPEDICPLGIFGNSGVVNLNNRAEEVMDRLGVPIIQGYDITGGQTWATPPKDGRHYPALIPLEISSLLSEITSALRQERRESA